MRTKDIRISLTQSQVIIFESRFNFIHMKFTFPEISENVLASLEVI